MRPTRVAACLLALVLCAAPVRAQDGSALTAPRSALAGPTAYSTPRTGGLLPSALFDPTRFSIQNSMSFGYTAGGAYQGSAGLFTSSLGYKVSNNSMLRVDVGAHMNPAFGGNGTDKGIFLQSAAFDWRPTRNSLVRVEYRDMRSPLQSPYGYGGYGFNGYGSNPGSAGWGTPYGANLGADPTLGSGLPGDPLRN